MDKAMEIPQNLRDLSRIFADEGETLWLVGGMVRDWLRGKPSADIDIATTATTDKQMAIYGAQGIRHILTGLQHGTITVVINGEIYEITTCRTETGHDGRHAVVVPTRSIVEDLRRRDLTVNAIAMTMDGGVVDPFGGERDIREGVVRFVGDPVDRIREDHLRILRWFRFLGRMGDATDPDAGAVTAIRDNAESLKSISVERIWSEMSRIVTGPQASAVIALMRDTGVLAAIGVTAPDLDAGARAGGVTPDPAVTMSVYAGPDAARLPDAWKWSRDERAKAATVVAALGSPGYGIAEARAGLVAGAPLEAVVAAMAVRMDRAAATMMRDWRIPVFPVTARDLLAAGMKPGVAIGDTMRRLQGVWAASGYEMGAGDLVRTVDATAT